jgi:non-ribosomal peptide synthetase component F
MRPARNAITVANAMADEILKTRVPSLVAERARSAPAQVALSTEDQKLTYDELDQRASDLAAHLQSLGAGPESVVGICLERSPEFVVAALATLKSGAAYLPLDPAYPAERLRFIAEDAGITLLISDAKLRVHFAECTLELIDIEAGPPPHQPLEVEIREDSLAYVIYTSGSTGQPKGVEVTHANLSHLVG